MKVGIILIVLFGFNLWTGIVAILNTNDFWYLISILVSIVAITYGTRRIYIHLTPDKKRIDND